MTCDEGETTHSLTPQLSSRAVLMLYQLKVDFTAWSNRSILSDLTWDHEAFTVNIRHHLPGNPVPVDQTPVAIIQGCAFLIQSHLVSFSEASVAHLIDFL